MFFGPYQLQYLKQVVSYISRQFHVPNVQEQSLIFSPLSCKEQLPCSEYFTLNQFLSYSFPAEYLISVFYMFANYALRSEIIGLKKLVGLVTPTFNGSDAHVCTASAATEKDISCVCKRLYQLHRYSISFLFDEMVGRKCEWVHEYSSV